jgi:hypothetical protein
LPPANCWSEHFCHNRPEWTQSVNGRLRCLPSRLSGCVIGTISSGIKGRFSFVRGIEELVLSFSIERYKYHYVWRSSMS